MALLLDPNIRDWVVLPLFIIMIITGLLRHYLMIYMSTNNQQRTPIPIHVHRTQSILQYSSYIRHLQNTGSHSSCFGGVSHQLYYYYQKSMIQILQNEIQYLEKVKQQNELNPSSTTTAGTNSNDPMDMMMKNPMSMMGTNMVFMVQNMVMMQGIQHFFSGFILLQVQIPLTIGFKSMFQKGVMDLPNLSSSYVSSVSWYFLVLYGLRSFIQLLLGSPSYEQKEQEMLYKLQYGYQTSNPNPAAPKQDIDTMIKMIQNEIDLMELLLMSSSSSSNHSIHENVLNSVEYRLLGPQRYPKIESTNTTMIGMHQQETVSNTDLLFSISQSKTNTTTPAADATNKKIQ